MNFTDEESRIMPGAKGDFIQGYNAQAVVEQDSHIVVATHVSQAANCCIPRRFADGFPDYF